MSVDRADRTGSTGESVDWNTDARRVIPPSTISSTTMSALLMPACGRALGALSIFTIKAGRSSVAGVPGSPVRGEMPGGTVVDGDDDDEVVDLDAAAGVFFFDEQPASTQASATRITV